jgi:TRAP-type uncharacterized transport system fused permease subunit
MVFNDVIILGGPLPVVVWNGAIAIVALTGFAVALEGFLWRPMPLWQRLLIVPGVVAVFWPDVAIEGAGAALILLMLALNRWGGRQDGPAAAAIEPKS